MITDDVPTSADRNRKVPLPNAERDRMSTFAPSDTPWHNIRVSLAEVKKFGYVWRLYQCQPLGGLWPASFTFQHFERNGADSFL